MERVKVAWNTVTRGGSPSDLIAVLTAQEQAQLVAKAEGSTHPTFRLSPTLIVEIPPASWGHGDLLIYLPHRRWLVRRNYEAHWYVDVGILTPLHADLYGWNDLWLDVIMPEPATAYHLLDADEFALALRQGQVSPEVAALAMDTLHDLVTLIHEGQFPPPEVRRAEEFASQRQPS